MKNARTQPTDSGLSRYPKLRRALSWTACTTLVVVLVWAGWWLYDRRYPSWAEEVQLSDGRVITIRQEHEYRENYGTSQSWVTIDLPELGGKRVWHSFLMPQRIDVIDGRVIVFGIPRGNTQFEFYKYPRNYMVALRWNGSDFERIPFLSLPKEVRLQETVLPCVPADRTQIITLRTKERSWCPARGSQRQFTRQIDLAAYQELARRYARMDGGAPISD